MSKRIENTVFRSEEWQQKNGEGILEVRGGELDIVLIVNDVPWVFDAFDCNGSIGRFMVLLDDNNRVESNQLIMEAAAQGFMSPVPLHEQIAPLLRLLPNGNYHLRLEQIHDYDAHLLSDYVWEKEKGNTIGYYPLWAQQQIVLWTQSELLLDDETINEYLALIDNGQRPALITVGSRYNSARFILDGHHKQFAYWGHRMGPYALHIEFQDSKPISVELAQRLVGDNLTAENYLKSKKAQTTRSARSK